MKKRRSIQWRFIFARFSVIIVIIGLFAVLLAGYERIDLLPVQEFIIFRIADGSELIDSIKKSPLGRLWNSKEMQPFLNNRSLEDALLKDFLQDTERPAVTKESLEIGRKLASLLKNELILAVELETDNNPNPGTLVLADMKKEDYQLFLQLSKQESEIRGEKVTFNYSTFQGVELVQEVYEYKDSKYVSWTAFSSGTMVSGKNRDLVEKCIVRLQGQAPTQPKDLLTFQIFFPDSFISQKLFPKPGVDLQSGLGPDEPGNQPPAPKRPSESEVIGLDAIGTVVFEFQTNPAVTQAGFRFKLKKDAGGILTLLSKDPIPPQHSIVYVPGDVLSYSVLRFDIHALWKEIPVMMAAIGSDAVAQYQTTLAQAGQILQLDIGRDLVGNLDTLVTFYSRLDGIDQRTLYIIQLRNAPGMEKTLGKLFGEGSWVQLMLKDKFELLELLEHRVYSVKIPQYEPPAEAPDDPGKPPDQSTDTFTTLGIAIVEGDMVIGSLDMVRSYIHGSRDNKAAREFYRSPFFSGTIRQVPSDAVAYGISDVSKWLEAGVNLIKDVYRRQEAQEPGFWGQSFSLSTGAEDEEQAVETADPISEYIDNLDFSKLPEAGFLRTLIGPMLFYSQYDGKEIIIKWELYSAVNQPQTKK